MKTLIAWSIIAASIFFGLRTAHAGTYAEFGAAVDHPGAHKYSDVKFVEVGKSGEDGKLAYEVGVGGWIDHTKWVNQGQVADNGYYVEALLGVEPKSEHFYLTYMIGPAIMDRTDALLGTNAQIGHEVGFGMRDVREVRVGVVIKHFSNAGVFGTLNEGRNFVGLRIQF